MNYDSHFSRRSRILIVVCLLACALALPPCAAFSVGNAKVVDLCANTTPVADFNYEIVSTNPPQVHVTDQSSSCANTWQWIIYSGMMSKQEYHSPIIRDPNGKNIVITMPSSGTFYIWESVGHNCNACTNLQTDYLESCCVGHKESKYLAVTFAAVPATTPSPSAVTTPATQLPQSSATPIAPTAPASQQTPQQSVAPVATAPATAPATAAVTTVAPAPAGQGSVPSGAISINTTPAGAEVWIDNEMKGASPAVISALSPGTHTLGLIKTGYQNISTTFIIESGQTREYSTGLIPVQKSPGFPALFAIGGIFVLVYARKMFR
jgi:hypothetical protein